MATFESIRSWIGESNFREYLYELPSAERVKVWQEYLDAIQKDKEQREKKRAELWDIPRNINITKYGFDSFEEADRAWASTEFTGDYYDNVDSWLNICRKCFLEKQAVENEKKIKKELHDIQLRSQEMAKWQIEREEERGTHKAHKTHKTHKTHKLFKKIFC
jgi:hypothetical protein